MALRYCFEASHVPTTLSACKHNDLAVVDTEGQTMVICPYFMEKNK